MKKIFLLLSLIIAATVSSLAGVIIETDHFSDIKQYLTPSTLVLLDIDDTLLIPSQTLGTDVWFLDRRSYHENNGMSSREALEKALAEWEGIRHLTKVEIVEEGSDKIVNELQANNYTVMGLTTQGLALTTRTRQQLQSLNIDLSKTAPSTEDHYFLNNNHGVLYRGGILFTSGTPKGPALQKLFELIDFYPERVVFINDKYKHLADVQSSMEEAGITFIGLRYTYSDERVDSYDQEVAECQWKYSSFENILSDEEAKKKIAQDRTRTYTPCGTRS